MPYRRYINIYRFSYIYTWAFVCFVRIQNRHAVTMSAFDKRMRGTHHSPDRVNPDFVDTSYQKWISRQMDARVLEYSDVSKITVCCGTWNVNARQLPDPYDLSSWLSLNGSPYADLYVISLQEMVDLNMINVVLVTSTSDDMASFWTQKILTTLNNMTGGDNYRLVTERHLVGLMGMVFAKKSVIPYITDVRSTVVYTGGYGTTGNKGGVAIRMDIKDSGMCFISTHFHANRNNVEQRNLDFQTIYDTAVFAPVGERISGKRLSKVGSAIAVSTSASSATSTDVTNDSSGSSVSVPSSSHSQHHTHHHHHHLNKSHSSNTNGIASAHTISHPALPSGIRPSSLNFANAKAHISLDVACHEHIFWLGDLNYRVGGELDDIVVMEKVQKNEWFHLLEYEQLTIQRELGNVFTGFEEGKIVFPPTYKFQPGTNNYEKRPDKKLRAPAWCDRILWKSHPHIQPPSKLLAYNSIGKLNISDHRPVHAWFETTIRQIVPEKMRQLYQDLLFSVDKWINASSPKLEISSRSFELGDITMETRHRVTMELHNNGSVMTEWAFVPKNDDTLVAPPWLRFSPKDGILAPGERMTVTATIFLSVELLGNLFPTYSGGPLRLDEIVVLRVKKGSDIFCIFSSSIPEENITETRNKAAQLSLSIQHRSVRYDNPILARQSAVVTNQTTVSSNAAPNVQTEREQADTRRPPIPSMPRNNTTAGIGHETIVETDEDETDDVDIDVSDIYSRKSTV